MNRSRTLRAALLAGGALFAIIALPGAAQEANAPPVDQIEIGALDLSNPDGAGLAISLTEEDARFALGALSNETQPRRLELEIAAGGHGAPLDVSLTRSTAFGGDDFDRRGGGSELRIGSGLVDRRQGVGGDRSVYVFVASEDEALTWQPGARGAQTGSLALQERIEVGDVSAGVTYERDGVQASLAYVERDAATRVGQENFSQDESFTGVTVTMRR